MCFACSLFLSIQSAQALPATFSRVLIVRTFAEMTLNGGAFTFGNKTVRSHHDLVAAGPVGWLVGLLLLLLLRAIARLLLNGPGRAETVGGRAGGQ